MSHWDFSHGKFGLLSQGKVSCDRVTLPNLRFLLCVLMFPPNSDMAHTIFKVRTGANACDCTRGCTDTVQESALKDDSGIQKKKLLHRGITSVSAACRSHAAYRLNYIPVPTFLTVPIPLLVEDSHSDSYRLLFRTAQVPGWNLARSRPNAVLCLLVWRGYRTA